MQSPFSVVAVGTREELGHPDYRAVEASHFGDRIEDDVVNIVAGVTDEILASRTGTLSPPTCTTYVVQWGGP